MTRYDPRGCGFLLLEPATDGATLSPAGSTDHRETTVRDHNRTAARVQMDGTPAYRVGSGHDTHRLVSGRPLILGGVRLEHTLGLDGHSDADILLHALTDAVLGAAGLGDIGELFPDTDPQFQGADSSLFLAEALKRIRQRGWEPVNVDCTIHAQQPKLSKFKPAIRQRVAELMGLPLEDVNVKAKTGERVGPVGREEAMCADAIVLIVRR